MGIIKSNNISVAKVAQENYTRRMAKIKRMANNRENYITRMVNSFIKNIKSTPKKVKKTKTKKQVKYLKKRVLKQVMSDPYYNFCLEEIRFYTEKINEIINEGLKDPKAYYEESKSEWKKIYQMIPFMYYMNQMEQDTEPDK